MKNEHQISLTVVANNLDLLVQELKQELDKLDPFASYAAQIAAAKIEGVVEFAKREAQR